VTDVVLSFMAVKSLVGFGDPAPVLLTVPGAMPASGKGNPSWGRVLDPMRDSEGRVLPGLFKRYEQFVGVPFADVNRIAAVGFSAGANNGLRNLLKHPEDRDRIDALISIDGLHPNIRRRIDFDSDDPGDAVIDWKGEMGPFVDLAVRGLRDQALAVWTASDITINRSDVASTRDALRLLTIAVAAQVQQQPSMGRVPELEDPPPEATVQLGDFFALWYAGADAEAHRIQARRVLPEILRRLLVPRWYPQLAQLPVQATPVGFELPATDVPSTPNPRRGSMLTALVPLAATLAGVAAAAFRGPLPIHRALELAA
jgi:hypothetical protein